MFKEYNGNLSELIVLTMTLALCYVYACLHLFLHLLFTTTLWGRYYHYPYFIDKGTELGRKVTCPRSYRWSVAERMQEPLSETLYVVFAWLHIGKMLTLTWSKCCVNHQGLKYGTILSIKRELLLWRNVYLVLWLIFWLGRLFFWNWATGVACIFLRFFVSCFICYYFLPFWRLAYNFLHCAKYFK